MRYLGLFSVVLNVGDRRCGSKVTVLGVLVCLGCGVVVHVGDRPLLKVLAVRRVAIELVRARLVLGLVVHLRGDSSESAKW